MKCLLRMVPAGSLSVYALHVLFNGSYSGPSLFLHGVLIKPPLAIGGTEEQMVSKKTHVSSSSSHTAIRCLHKCLPPADRICVNATRSSNLPGGQRSVARSLSLNKN